MRTQFWRIAMFSLFIFGLGCVGCAKRPTSTPAIPPPTRFVDASVVYAADTTSQLIRVPRRNLPREFGAVAELRDIHFAFDKADIGPAAAQILDVSAEWLKAHPSHLVLVAGHTDERGTDEYNLVLGERRAQASVNYLVSRGVASTRFTIISYGEERGVCRERQERCWSRNRRAHFAVKPA
jgi:peptidoglycan-associated lipoprotein